MARFLTRQRFVTTALALTFIAVVALDTAATDAGALDATLDALPLQDTPTPTECPKWYEIRVHAFPDDVGITDPYIGKPGCDGLFTAEDRMEAAYAPLEEIRAVVYSAGDPQNVLASQVMRRRPDDLDLAHTFVVCEPPPLEVELTTTKFGIRMLCPNFSNSRLLQQSDFDRSIGGDYVSEAFPFWYCGTCNMLNLPYAIRSSE